MAKIMVVFFGAMLLNSQKALSQLHLSKISDTIAQKSTIRVLPRNFYSQHLGFFCKKEVQLQKLTTLPVYLRLGSKEEVDKREGKGLEYRTLHR